VIERTNDKARLLRALEALVPADREERASLDAIRAFLARHEDPFDRRIPEGHLTGSLFVVSAAFDSVLLLHHRRLERWLQPGGHAEPGETRGEAVALREALEARRALGRIRIGRDRMNVLARRRDAIEQQPSRLL